MAAMPTIDTRSQPSLSFAPPEPRARVRGPRIDGPADRGTVPVGPGRPAIVAPTHGSGGPLGQVSDYPVQYEKVQAPPLREDTLARDRLLDWLNVKIHRRVVLVLAEAGYGKTTLLADFTRRTRVRVAWYRLDRGDRDWLGFIAHLVAAFRVHQPDFGPVTQTMIHDASLGSTTREMVLESFVRELAMLSPEPASLVLDDFHLVDDSEDARVIVRTMLARAPERLTFVLVSRTAPSLPLARLRSLGEVAELHTSDLRFAPEETERLFRETYALDLEPGVVAELSRRTEGWVASLQLVRAAIRDRNRSEIRAFVRSLSGAEGNLYDYLAEEVVGELSADLQQFLMRTSLLEVIEPVLGGVAARTSSVQTTASIADGEMLGLFGRLGPNTRDHVRAHPLVRDFLQARLRRSLGADAVVEIHREVARAAESRDWRIAGHHYLEAGDLIDARRVLATAIETILATGAYAAAEELVSALHATDHPDPNVLVVLSRLAQQKGHLETGRDFAQAAFEADGNSAAAALNLQSALMNAGDIDAALETARYIEERGDWAVPAMIARATRLMLQTSTTGSIEASMSAMDAVIGQFANLEHSHYAGVAKLGLGYLHLARGTAGAALESADDSIADLLATSGGQELVSARLLRANALAFDGRLAEAREEVRAAGSIATLGQAFEVALEAAMIEALYGDPLRAELLLRPYEDRIDPSRDVGEQAALVMALALSAQGRVVDAAAIASKLSSGEPRTTVAMEAMRWFARATIEVQTGDPNGRVTAAKARETAAAQGADLWVKAASILCQAGEPENLSVTIENLAESEAIVLTLACETIGTHWHLVSERAMPGLLREITARKERWRPVLRKVIETRDDHGRLSAATILEGVGERSDVARLRRVAREFRGYPGTRDLGRTLARRLADPILVSDLGRVEVFIGDRTFDGSQVRRKVLALLCFLISRTNMSATREEVVEALWPDLEPSTALNSLNQTVYFLRRVFEPGFVEETSPGYIGQDGELIWLDQRLVTSHSQQVKSIIRSAGSNTDPVVALELAHAYVGRFAIDFMYDDWAADYRDALHASYLRVVEGAIHSEIDAGRSDRGIQIAQLVAEVEPDADEIQLGLLRLLRLAGATAAAAEQYEHYARSQRELGAEPEPFDAI